jgi:hypothetical protein
MKAKKVYEFRTSGEIVSMGNNVLLKKQFEKWINKNTLFLHDYKIIEVNNNIEISINGFLNIKDLDSITLSFIKHLVELDGNIVIELTNYKGPITDLTPYFTNKWNNLFKYDKIHLRDTNIEKLPALYSVEDINIINSPIKDLNIPNAKKHLTIFLQNTLIEELKYKTKWLILVDNKRLKKIPKDSYWNSLYIKNCPNLDLIDLNVSGHSLIYDFNNSEEYKNKIYDNLKKKFAEITVI